MVARNSTVYFLFSFSARARTRRPRTAELRDLFVSHVLKFRTRRQERFLEGQVGPGVGVIGVRRVEQGARQRPAGPTGRIGELEGRHVVDCVCVPEEETERKVA